jgi:hypothetical protein
MQQVMLEFAPRAAAPTAAPTQLRSSGTPKTTTATTAAPTRLRRRSNTPKTNDAVPVNLRYSQVYGKKPKGWQAKELEPATQEEIDEAQRMTAENFGYNRVEDAGLSHDLPDDEGYYNNSLLPDEVDYKNSPIDDETRFYNSLPQGMREYAKANNFYKDQIFTNAEIDAFRNDKFFQRHPEYLENLVRTQHIKKLDDRIKDRQYRDKQRQKWKAENAKYMEEMRKQYGDEAVGLAPGNETFNPNLYRETADFNMKYNPLSFGDYQEYEERNERY